MLTEDVPLVLSRQVMQELAVGLHTLPPDNLKDVGVYVLDNSVQRAGSFEEALSVIREALATVYEQEEDWSQAAKLLSGIPLESGTRVLNDNYKVEKYIQIAMLYLQVWGVAGVR